MKKISVLLTLLIVLLLSACEIPLTSKKTPVNWKNEISDILDIDVHKGSVITEYDSHGGFLGDGMTFVTISFSDDTLLIQMSESGDWRSLPLTETLTAVVYGISTENSRIGPYLEKNEETVIPEIQNGYYWFLDRHSQSTDNRDDTNVISRGSQNFTLAIYDTDAGILYYIESDT